MHKEALQNLVNFFKILKEIDDEAKNPTKPKTPKGYIRGNDGKLIKL